MQVSDIMHTDVKSADAEDTFADVAKVMRSNGISSVVVLDKQGKLSGIVTERDIVNLVAAGGDPHSVKVAHGMTRRGLETVGPKTDVAEAADKMVSLNIRHLPIVDRGKVVGIVSIRDLTRWAAEELTGGHEMPDIARSERALRAATELQKQRRLNA
jgi:CBS domain-containing protein